MLAYLEALLALHDHGTMNKAAVRLHVSQSAISKRIDTLEHQLKQKLIVPKGRRVELTPKALRLIEKVRPVLFELKSSMLEEETEANGSLIIDVSVSVFISHIAQVLSKVRQALPQLTLKINTNHASIAVERVRSGDSMLAIVQGNARTAPELMAQPIYMQEMVIVPSGLKPFRIKSGADINVIAIEAYTEAWAFIKQDINNNSPQWKFNINVQSEMQSFSAITQMARAGFGHGLVPLDVARTLGVKDKYLVFFPEPGIKIPVSMIGTRTTLARPEAQKFLSTLIKYSSSRK